MQRIGVVGLNWRQGGPEALARFTLPAEGREARIAELAREVGAEELVYLATCNRVEIAFVTADGVPVAEYRRRLHAALGGPSDDEGAVLRELRAWEGEGAAEHVFLVATGLDSARLGETEIVGQVRDALEVARAAGLANWRLGLLYDEALKLAKRARSATGLGEGRTSLAEIGLDAIRARLKGARGRVALLGISPMTERCARELVGEGFELVLVNRTRERAEALASELGTRASATSLDAFRTAPPAVDAIVSATAAPGALLGRDELARLFDAHGSVRGPLCIDFATDPDIDPEAAGGLGLERIGMDAMIATAEGNRKERLRESGAARELVDRALERFAERIAQRTADQSIAALRASYEATARTQVEKLLDKHFPALDDPRAELVRRFAERLAKHFAHVPATGLRELASAHGPGLVNEFFAHADAALARELDAALSDEQLFARFEEEKAS